MSLWDPSAGEQSLLVNQEEIQQAFKKLVNPLEGAAGVGLVGEQN